MRCVRKFLAVLLLLCAACCFSQDAQVQEKGLTELSSAIRDRLTDLKKNSAIVTERLTMLSENLEFSQAEAQWWRERSTSLSSSLMTINEELSSSFETITRYEQQIKTKNKALTWLIIILLIMTAGKVAGYILYAKGIRLPRWLDILL